jgi:hypothetical protein
MCFGWGCEIRPQGLRQTVFVVPITSITAQLNSVLVMSRFIAFGLPAWLLIASDQCYPLPFNCHSRLEPGVTKLCSHQFVVVHAALISCLFTIACFHLLGLYRARFDSGWRKPNNNVRRAHRAPAWLVGTHASELYPSVIFRIKALNTHGTTRRHNSECRVNFEGPKTQNLLWYSF